jgi:transcription elongation GreA/GreB family factor
MNKKEIVNQLVAKAESELAQIKKAYNSTKDMVQNGDLKSDGKYDTRATEANYLADGQRQRITDLESEVGLLQEVSIKDLSRFDRVSIGSVVGIEHKGNTRKYFISPITGGSMLSIEDEALMVVSAFSPIGSGAINLGLGETFELDFKGELREYEIKSIQ